MQVKFHYVKFKNLLSYGNVETTVDLQSFSHTIVTAKNGSGKSSVLDAICYGVYGKPYRNIKLGQLINSINKKALLVTVEFSIGADVYKVIRGQKPSIFEIYKNNTLVIEDSASSGYQEYLETQVLNINFKTFKQIVIIGSASYKPFMDLKADERRAITEEVLDIAIFSSMQEIAKKRMAEVKSTVDSLSTEITMLKSQIESQKDLVETLTKESDESKNKNEAIIAEATRNISRIEMEITAIDEKLSSQTAITATSNNVKTAKSTLDSKLSKISNKISDLRDRIEFYNEGDCPTCGQHIDEAYGSEKILEAKTSIESLDNERTKVQELINEFVQKIEKLDIAYQEFIDATNHRKNLIYSLNVQKQTLDNTKIVTSSDSLQLSKTKLKELIHVLVKKTDDKNDATKSLLHHKAAIDILKDNGIKSKVIATFIPILNKMINDYLQLFDLFVSFELDETFNETIKSRDRDSFSYNSFSEGEKQKIDLSILFAWRRIAMSRNSVSTNLLIFDETLDKSLDTESVDTFVNILGSIEESVNSIVISHRDVVPELFDRHITINKVRDFSIMHESTSSV
jgi:DNA repair exonuclease SbcCD ATPase subunit